jgi:hypothetical protein
VEARRKDQERYLRARKTHEKKIPKLVSRGVGKHAGGIEIVIEYLVAIFGGQRSEMPSNCENSTGSSRQWRWSTGKGKTTK